MKIQNALVSNIFDRSQRYFAHVTTVTLSWRVQNIVVIGRVYFTLECFEFSSNFEFDRNMLSGTGAMSKINYGNRRSHTTQSLGVLLYVSSAFHHYTWYVSRSDDGTKSETYKHIVINKHTIIWNMSTRSCCQWTICCQKLLTLWQWNTTQIISKHCYFKHKCKKNLFFWFKRYSDMMTSSNGNVFRVTGHLCGEFTGDRWISLTKTGDAELWCFLWSVPE